MNQIFNFTAIGTVHACYKDKFGVPRQPGLVNVLSSIELHAPYNRIEACRGLSDFSHIWITFVFHQTMQQGWHPTVRPPRLGGNERVGVFASRSMFRPNPVGLSLVKLKAVREENGTLYLDIIGADLMDGTPVLDIKPYLPYAEAITDAQAGYATELPGKRLHVSYTQTALEQIKQYQTRWPDLQRIITDILQLDPRPAYQNASANQKTEFALRLYDLDVKWRVSDDCIEVYELILMADR